MQNKKPIPTIDSKVLFKQVCFHSRPFVYLRALRVYGHNMQLKANSEFVEKNTIISNVCGWCDNKITDATFDYFGGYWQPNLWRPVHKWCKSEYKNFEAIECQTIDADCNDCKYFIRGKEAAKGVWHGECSKFNKPTIANSVFASGHTCFVHRKQQANGK